MAKAKKKAPKKKAAKKKAPVNERHSVARPNPILVPRKNG